MNEQVHVDVEMTDIQKMASTVVKQAFDRNQQYWGPVHRFKRMLYDLVRGIPEPDKPKKEKRSNIETGLAWMMNDIGYDTLKNAITNQDQKIEIEGTRLNQEILYTEEMINYINHLYTDERTNIKRDADRALWDLHATGCSVLCASMEPEYRRYVKTEIDEAGKEQQVEYQELIRYAPKFTTYAPWDVFPTAGADDCQGLHHEDIIRISMTTEQLREWERAGIIYNVDALLKARGKNPNDNQSEAKKPERDMQAENRQKYDKVDILVYWGLFPIYANEDFSSSENDMSKDEVECLIIRPVDYDIILALARNPFENGLRPVFYAGYYFVNGEFWPISFFEILYKLFIHHHDWFNTIQDAASADVYPDRIVTDDVEIVGDGPSKTIKITTAARRNGATYEYVMRPASILPDAYDHRNYLEKTLEKISGIIDFVQGVQSEIGNDPTATATLEMAQRINVRFREIAIGVERSLMQPMYNWIMSMLSQASDDEEVMEFTGLPVNPFKQFDPMIPNSAYRIKLNAAVRAADNIASQNMLIALYREAINAKPMPDEDGNLFTINSTLMLYNIMKGNAVIQKPEQYKVPITPDMTPQPPPQALEAPNVG